MHGLDSLRRVSEQACRPQRVGEVEASPGEFGGEAAVEDQQAVGGGMRVFPQMNLCVDSMRLRLLQRLHLNLDSHPRVGQAGQFASAKRHGELLVPLALLRWISRIKEHDGKRR